MRLGFVSAIVPEYTLQHVLSRRYLLQYVQG